VQTVLVTGATGCVGSNLALYLASAGYKVRAFVRPSSDAGFLTLVGIKVVHGDICDEDSVRRAVAGCDTVFHTAAVVSFARSRRVEQLRVNVNGTRNVARACREEGTAALIHVSSIAAIGIPEGGSLADEETPVDRTSATAYRLSKILSEDEIHNASALGLQAVIVNPSVIIGEQDRKFHGGQLVRGIWKRQIPFYVEGGMNIVYVGDVVRGMVLAAERGMAGERYILGGENLTHEEAFRRTARLIGRRAPFAKLPLSILRIAGSAAEHTADLLHVDSILTADLALNAGRFLWYSSAKAREKLGYETHTFDHAILAAFRWYRANGFL
jgi:dihydroflavonol-4-reductase